MLKFYTVYDHPKDYPDEFVVRGFSVGGNSMITHDEELTFRSSELEDCRQFLRNFGLTPIHRDTSDDPAIVESWI